MLLLQYRSSCALQLKIIQALVSVPSETVTDSGRPLPAYPQFMRGVRRLSHLLGLSLCAALAACASAPAPAVKSPISGMALNQFAKTDTGRIAELDLQETMVSLRTIMEKLYKRNPREWRKTTQPSPEGMVRHVFDSSHDWYFAELTGKRGAEAIDLAFRDDFHNDRVLAYMVGVTTMVQDAFNNKAEFFLIVDLDPQKLHNCSRNIELAAHKINTARNLEGQLFMMSNDASWPARDLSVEREFGKVVGNLDLLAKIVAEQTNLTFVRVVQNLATSVFLPVK